MFDFNMYIPLTHKIINLKIDCIKLLEFYAKNGDCIEIYFHILNWPLNFLHMISQHQLGFYPYKPTLPQINKN